MNFPGMDSGAGAGDRDPTFGPGHDEDEDHEDFTIPLEVPEEADLDLYAALNVSRTATNEEITAAYRRFSRMYHPDKHLEDDKKPIAEKLFSKIKKAHEVLSDPSKRAIYDTIGLAGLESQGHELVERYATPQEIREAYERLNREKQDREIERKTNPKGSFTVNVNATEVFNPVPLPEDDPFYADIDVPYVELTGFSLNQSIETPLTPKDTLILSGVASADNGRGQGNISCGLRRTISNKAWGELEMGGSTNGMDFGLKGFSQFGRRFFTNFSLMFQARDGRVKPVAVISVGNQLDAHSVGTLTWRMAGNGALIGGYTRDNGKNRVSLSIHLGIPHSYAMIQTSTKPTEDKKLRLNFKAGTFGAMIEYGIEAKISHLSTVGALMIVGVPYGVMLRLKFVRANQSYIFPIQLSEELIPKSVFYGTIAPIAVYLILKKLIMDPYEKEQGEKNKEKKKMAERAKLAEKKAEAEAAIALLRNTYMRSRTEEEENRGLVIIKASYGRFLAGPGESPITDDQVIDVTVPLQCLVVKSTLDLHKGTKSNLQGFYDPAPGETKGLSIALLYRNKNYNIAILDNDPVKIPTRNMLSD